MTKRTKAAIGPATASEASEQAIFAERENTRSPGYVSVYANDVQIEVTPWDFRLTLGEISELPTPSKPTLTVNTLAGVRLSPQLAKRLTMIMVQQLNAYEGKFGEIPIPKDEAPHNQAKALMKPQ